MRRRPIRYRHQGERMRLAERAPHPRRVQACASEAAAFRKLYVEVCVVRLQDGPVLSDPRAAAQEMLKHLRNRAREHLYAIYTAADGQVLGVREWTGGIAKSNADPIDLFRSALLLGAQGIIVAHNHPSGNTRFSDADTRMTARLVDMAALFGITVLDHVLVTTGRMGELVVVSMAEVEPSVLARR